MNREAMSALLVYNRPDPLEELKQVLESQGVRASVARSCGEAALRLWSERPPDVVFTDTQLGDGTWADVLKVAASAQAPTNAIVVSRCADVRFYLETIERGAFDYLTPPFDPTGVACVVRHAEADIVQRRRTQARVNRA
jgi:DNA-binding NtrC family response regulator